MKNEIEGLLKEFVGKLEVAIEQAAHQATEDAVKQALGSLAEKKRSAIPVRLRKPKGMKRDPKEIERVRKALLVAIKRQPGQRSEDLQAALDLDVSQISLPLKQLVDSKSIMFKGVARGRRYEAR